MSSSPRISRIFAPQRQNPALSSVLKETKAGCSISYSCKVFLPTCNHLIKAVTLSSTPDEFSEGLVVFRTVERDIMSGQDSRSPKSKSNGSSNADWPYATEENADFFENLVEKCAIDAGAPFQPEVLKALAYLKQENSPAFESLRALLKRNGCRVAALDEAIAEISRENERGPNQTGLLISLVDDIELPRRDNHDARHVILHLFAEPPAVAGRFSANSSPGYSISMNRSRPALVASMRGKRGASRFISPCHLSTPKNIISEPTDVGNQYIPSELVLFYFYPMSISLNNLKIKIKSIYSFFNIFITLVSKSLSRFISALILLHTQTICIFRLIPQSSYKFIHQQLFCKLFRLETSQSLHWTFNPVYYSVWNLNTRTVDCQPCKYRNPSLFLFYVLPTCPLNNGFYNFLESSQPLRSYHNPSSYNYTQENSCPYFVLFHRCNDYTTEHV